VEPFWNPEAFANDAFIYIGWGGPSVSKAHAVAVVGYEWRSGLKCR